MKPKFLLNEDEILCFHAAVADVKKLPQNTSARPLPPKKPKKRFLHERLLKEQLDASFYFSDEFQPQLDREGPTRYLHPDADYYELKKLRRGDYPPDLFLDLHGLTQQQAKKELGALIATCRQEHAHCACVMHGHGKHVLKQQTPLWLAQHPDVIAFHQAPKEWGGTAALLVLMKLIDADRVR